MNNSTLSLEQQDFVSFFNEIKNKVSIAQQKAILAVNAELRSNFPLMKGFSIRNLKYMRQFASVYATDKQFVQEVLAQLSWY